MSAGNNLPVVKKNLDASFVSKTISSEIPPVLFKEFLDNQTKELELRNRQLELEKQKDNHTFDWAKNSLDAQVIDREKDRIFRLISRRNSFVFVTIITALFIGLLVFALMMNKDQIALEIIKAVIFIITGGAGGYAVGRQHISAPSISHAATRDH
ncbi:MAG: hypothetical protein V1899_04425 [Planctomycetota bacterium]